MQKITNSSQESSGLSVAIPLSKAQVSKNLLSWLAALSPVLFVLVIGFFVFKQAIITSIESTPHPELVYVILGAFFIGVIFTCITLARYTLEINFLSRWNDAPFNERKPLLLNSKINSYLLPIYHVLLGIRPMAAEAQQAVLEQEIATINERLHDRLAFPNFLAGALVGLGLVGTFIGLLGTLEDLGKLFAGLAQSGGGDTNPTELFADMVRRLQGPMHGMGTAFIASLYGLLGSLVLGLQILVVGKVGHDLSNQMHTLIRGNDAALLVDSADGHVVSTVKIVKRAAFQVLHAIQAAQSKQSMHWDELAIQMRLHQERSLKDTQLLRREILSVTESSKALTQAVRESIQADDRYRKSVPRTSYWQDAWIKVQAYLQRSDTDQALSELLRVSRMQSNLLIDISSTLSHIDQRLSAHLNAHLTDETRD